MPSVIVFSAVFFRYLARSKRENEGTTRGHVGAVDKQEKHAALAGRNRAKEMRRFLALLPGRPFKQQCDLVERAKSNALDRLVLWLR